MVIVAPKRLLPKLVILHIVLFAFILSLSNFSLIDEEIHLRAKTYSVKIHFIVPVDQKKFDASLTLNSEFPKHKPKYTVSWINSSTAEIKFRDVQYPQGQEVTLKIEGAETMVPLVNKNHVIKFRLPIEPDVIRFNTKRYISTLEPIMITFNVPMEAEGIKGKMNVINLKTGSKTKGEFKPVVEIIDGIKYEDYSRWVFKPERRLNHSEQYEIVVEQGIVSKAGIKLKRTYNKIIAIASKPEIIMTIPHNLERKVSLYPEIELTASESLKRAQVKMRRQDEKSKKYVEGTVSVIENKIFYTSEVALLPNSKYIVEVIGYSLYNEPTEKITFSFETINLGETY